MAPRSLDFCVCCRRSTLGPLVNFRRGCSGTELSLEYLLSAWNFLKGKSAAKLHSRPLPSPPSFFLFYPFILFFFHRNAGIVIACDAVWQSCHNHGCCFSPFFSVPLPDPRSPHPFCQLTRYPPLFTMFKKKKKNGTFSFTPWRVVLMWEVSAAFSMIQPWEPRGSQRPLTQGSRWGVRRSRAPSPAPYGVRALPRQHIIHILKASWTKSMEHKESKETYHPPPTSQLLSTSVSFGASKLKLDWIAVI